jgi:hypothetical protein
MVAALSGEGGIGRDDASLKQRLLTEAPNSWRELQRGLSQVRGTCRFSRADLKPDGSFGPARITNVWHFKLSGPSLVYEEQRVDESGKVIREIAMGQNSKYSFSVDKNHHRDRWRLLGVVSGNRDQVIQPYDVAVKGGFLTYLSAPWSFMGVPWTSVLEDPGFSIIDVTAKREGNRDLVRVAFEYRSSGDPNTKDPKKKSPLLMLKSGSAVFDPSSYWAVQSFEATSLAGGTSSTLIVYLGEHEGIPLPRSHATTVRMPNEPAYLLEATFENLTIQPTDESEFTLSAFGLPEPQGIGWEKKSSRWWLWAGVAGGALLVLGLGIRWLRRGYKAEPSRG